MENENITEIRELLLAGFNEPNTREQVVVLLGVFFNN